jgi:hypothetical protein
MSNALAIAATTAVITTGIHEAVINAGVGSILGTPTVSALPPDRITIGDTETSQINLFMYMVSPNPGWRNVDLPSRDSRGRRVSSPPLAVNLHYLLSTYGAQDFHAEMLLGIAMQQLHEVPVLTRDVINSVFSGSLSPAMQMLSESGLADQIEEIRIFPYVLSTEEMTRLWGAFQDKYRPTAAYQATVVLIQSDIPYMTALPVITPQSQALAGSAPVIDSVSPLMLPLTAGAQIVLQGRNLLTADTIARFGTGEEVAPLVGGSGSTITVQVPSTLPIGINTVQVVQRMVLGAPPAREVFESAMAPFMIRPSIQTILQGGHQVYDITVDNPYGSASNRSATLIVQLTQAVGVAQRVEALLNQIGVPAGSQPQAYTFLAPARTPPDSPPSTDPISIPITGVTAGQYLVRIRVDGAESTLDMDSNNRFSAPRVTI